MDHNVFENISRDMNFFIQNRVKLYLTEVFKKEGSLKHTSPKAHLDLIIKQLTRALEYEVNELYTKTADQGILEFAEYHPNKKEPIHEQNGVASLFSSFSQE